MNVAPNAINVARILEDEILERVERPSRYLGSEVNAVLKDPAEVEVRLAFAFPDLYDLGLGNLGLHILYAVVNKLPWAWAERAYAPAIDMEKELRDRNLPLFALESKDGLGVMDGIGITLQSELTWTNILNIIDLAGIPLRTADRDDSHPLTFAGGPAVFNPEPIAPFMDFFVIGDGEDAVVEICHVLRRTKGQSRMAKLEALAELEGVYVPALYPFDVLDDGQVLPSLTASKIRKRLTRDLDGATFPTDYIVPFTKQVHDRVSLEVLRGCTQGCRFCQAGMVTRPVRERSLNNVDELLRKTLDNTGYEEVSLVSLSTCDHSRVKQLVENTVNTVRDKHVAISLPSLRLDSFSVDLSDMVSTERKSGLTFAPEAASPRLRAVINKWIPDEELLQMSAAAYSKGWGHVKLYFMIGLPTERDDDIEAIADLAKRTVQAGNQLRQGARVNLGVSTFVPKPFTPFQWAEQIDHEETSRRQSVLIRALDRDRNIKFGRHDPEETFLEGLVSRADRRAGDLIEAAWRLGCRFDAWGEHLRFDLWLKAIDEVGYDVKAALRERDPDERLPWDHIDVFIPKEWFKADYERAMELKHAEDCRHKRCHRCGVIDEERELCASMLRENVEGRKLEKAWERASIAPFVEPEPAQRLWFRITRTGPARFLGHLENANAWVRSLRRSGAPLAYSRGFHPHPKVAFSTAVPLGIASLGEYMDVTLTERVDPEALLATLRATLPQGFDSLGVSEVKLNAKSLMGLVDGAEFRIEFPHVGRRELASLVSDLLARDEILVERRTKVRVKKGRFRGREKKFVSVNIRPMIRVMSVDPEAATVNLTVGAFDGKPGKAREVVGLLTDRPERARITKIDSLVNVDGELASLASVWASARPTAASTAGV